MLIAVVGPTLGGEVTARAARSPIPVFNSHHYGIAMQVRGFVSALNAHGRYRYRVRHSAAEIKSPFSPPSDQPPEFVMDHLVVGGG